MDKQDIRKMALEWGADFFGVAAHEPYRSEPTIPDGLLAPYIRAISMGIGLSRGVFENLVDGPTPHYSHHYQTVNALLDQVALRITGLIQKNGGRAIPIPASQILDWDGWRAAISHKAVARMAGLGWQGKSLLLVNPEVGRVSAWSPS
jgi:epoxyqueuosine reductase QueG